MKKNIVLIIVILLLSSGCHADYTLRINPDLTVSESVIALESAPFFNQFETSPVSQVIAYLLQPNLPYLNEHGFRVEQVMREAEAGVRISNGYKSIEHFREISEFPNQFVNEWEYIEDGKYRTLKITGMISNTPQDQSGVFPIELARINIQIPFDVTEHNADRHDASNNMYIWFIDEVGVEREILLTFNVESLEESDFRLYVIGGIIIVLVIIAMIVFSKMADSKERNKV